MEEVIIPFQVANGVVVVGSFAAEEEDDLYVWIRRFDREAERERIYEAVYESDQWKQVMLPQVVEMLDREKSVITRLEAAPKLVIR